MDKDVTMEASLSKSIDKLKVVQQVIYSDPEMAYNALCAIQRDLDQVAITALRNVNTARALLRIAKK